VYGFWYFTPGRQFDCILGKHDEAALAAGLKEWNQTSTLQSPDRGPGEAGSGGKFIYVEVVSVFSRLIHGDNRQY